MLCAMAVVSALGISNLALASLLGWVVFVVLASLFRGRPFAAFRGVLLAVHSLIVVALAPRFGPVAPLVYYLHATVFVHSLMLTRPRMRPLAYRVLVSWPEAYFQAATLLAAPWAIAMALGYELWGLPIPYALAAIGMVQSLSWRREERELVVRDGVDAGALQRHRCSTAAGHGRALRLVQITDPHLGPFMSVERLRRVCQRAVASKPDLVVLTGDFLTMESQHDPQVLGSALAPLRQLEGRTLACLGNHDLEAPDTVRRALASVGVRLLVDEAAVLDTAAGRVQVVGVDFRWRDRKTHLAEVCAANPRDGKALRLLLLHDPSAMKHVPLGEGDLVLSGHTHGGQLGLVSFGLALTMISLASRSPDHGLWARGTDRLYVHRGTGHYGFPLRLGVPAEESLLLIRDAATLEG